MKVFIGLTEVAGYGSSLCKGFAKIGIPCIFVSKQKHPFEYGNNVDNFLIKTIQFLTEKTKRTSEIKLLNQLFWTLIRKFFNLLLFLWALSKYNVFIFLFNATFLPRKMDLPILKLFRKKIIFIQLGSEVRPDYIDGFINCEDINECILSTQRKKRDIKDIEKYSDYIINYPPTGSFLEKKFIIGLIMGFPKEVEPNKYNVGYNSVFNKIRILHSPSDPKAKGTAVIRDTIKSLQKKGYNIEFIELIGQLNSVVLEHLAQCDFVVDQMYSDTPLAGFATEAAFFGKPAVVGGYYAEQIYRDIPRWCIPPSEFVQPDNIEQAIEKLICDVDYRTELGKQAQQFAEDYLKPERVAERYLRLIEDNVPDEWYYDPHDIEYTHGGGLSEKRAKDLVCRVIRSGGVEALQLKDKPKLQRKFLDFAGVE